MRRHLPRKFASVLARPHGLKHLTLEQFVLELASDESGEVAEAGGGGSSGSALGLTWEGLFEALGRSKSAVSLALRSDAPEEVDISQHNNGTWSPAQKLGTAAAKALLSVRTLTSLSLTHTQPFGVLEGLLWSGLNNSRSITRLDLSHSSIQ